ncbi:unnamed protein product [Phytomonas sp. Hart1]|nr:unnamed protein product [Phytomonas sp. Hart1]|eukprot:CCW71874.1 unnamed protein product [Phytomonas sp. isolate Hart1]
MKKNSPLYDSLEDNSPAERVNPMSTLTPHKILGVEEPPIEHLKRTSLEYFFYVAVVLFDNFGVIFYELVLMSNRYRELLKPHLNPPWVPFCWLGSHGVDVADGQWYYTISFLPFAIPIMVVFLFLSRRQRRGRRLALTPPEAPNTVPPRTHQTRSSKTQAAMSLIETKSLNLTTSLRIDGNGGGVENSLSLPQSGPSEAGNGVWSSPRDPPNDKSTSEVVYARRDLAKTHLLHFLFGLFIALGVTGTGCLFGLAFIIANYYAMKALYRSCRVRVAMGVMWTSQIAILFLHYYIGRYRFSWFGLGFLDDLWTPLFRWTMIYNMSMLRMISFNMDLREAMDIEGSATRRAQLMEKHESTCVECAVIRDKTKSHTQSVFAEEIRCLRYRTDCPRLPEEYHLLSYLAYLYYPPLYLTGPMLSFNAYTSYLNHATRGVVGKAIWRYALRCAGVGVLLSFTMHYAHVISLLDLYKHGPSKTAMLSLNPQDISGIQFSQTQKLTLFYALLGFMWMKFDFIWKFSRLVAFFDGVEPPEDMRRCFTNTSTIQNFWRDWHASFNMWILRYMYIPMGGRNNKVFTIFVIFFFIAIWHDIDLRLLCWAGFTCIFFIQEIFISSYFTTTKNKFIQRLRRRSFVWRWIRVTGISFSMLELIFINLTGFMLGTDAPTSELKNLFWETTWSCIIFVTCSSFCFASVSVQDLDQEKYEDRVLRIKYHLKPK